MLIQSLINPRLYNLKSPRGMGPVGLEILKLDEGTARVLADKIKNDEEGIISYHVLVDSKEALQLLPFNRVSNSGVVGDYIVIGVMSSLDDTTELLVELLSIYGWDVSRVKSRDYDLTEYLIRVQSLIKDLKTKRILTKGDTVSVIKGKHESSDVYVVKEVKGDKVYLSDINCWVRSKDVEMIGSITDSDTITPVSELNVRVGIGINKPKIGMVYPGDILTVIKRENGWCYISYKTRLNKQITGWVCEKYTKNK